VAQWIEQLSDVRQVTRAEYEKTSVRWISEWKTIDDLDDRVIAGYVRKRLGEVRGKTVRNETSALRRFLGWAVETGLLEAAPAVPTLKVSTSGTPFRQRRRTRAPELSPDEVRAFLAALPAKSATGFIVRDRLIVAFETTLRPATLSRLAVPLNYAKGASTLILTDEDDKEQYGRELPLSRRAREALDRSCPKEPGTIFGRHKVDAYVRAAAAETLPAHKAAVLCAQHLRSAGITRLLELSANLPGVQLLAGHKHGSTTSRYIRPSTRAARAVVEAADRISGTDSGDKPRMRRKSA